MNKGQYGYIGRYKRNKWISIIILGIVIIIGVAFSLIVFGTTKTVVILLPILTALPFAKQIVAVVLVKGFTPLSNQEFDKLKTGIKDYNEENVLYDVSISRYEGIRFFPAAVVKDGRILFYYRQNNKKSISLTELKGDIMKSFEDMKNPYIILVTDDLQDFIDKANGIKAPNPQFKEKDKKMKERLFELGV